MASHRDVSEPADERSLVLTGVVASETLRAEFYWMGDRHGHRLVTSDERGRHVWLESVEGNADDVLTSSPVLQELQRHEPAGRSPSSLAVGRAARRHWSLAVDLAPAAQGLTFDVACRGARPWQSALAQDAGKAREQASDLDFHGPGSRYRWDPQAMALDCRSDGRVQLSTAAGMLIIEPLVLDGEPARCVVDSKGGMVRIVPALRQRPGPPRRGPDTLRWQYQVRFARAVPA